MGGSWDVAFQDILKAFEQFLLDTGDRPIVVAGHSQGLNTVVKRVIFFSRTHRISWSVGRFFPRPFWVAVTVTYQHS